MSAVSDAEIAEFRALTAELGFPDTYTITRTTYVSDGAGGQTPTPTTVTETPGTCSLVAGGLNPTERVIADRAGYQTPIVVELPYATSLAPKDVLVVNGTRTLKVAGVLKDGDWGITAKAICQETA